LSRKTTTGKFVPMAVEILVHLVVVMMLLVLLLIQQKIYHFKKLKLVK
jgi:hypothetical protein